MLYGNLFMKNAFKKGDKMKKKLIIVIGALLGILIVSISTIEGIKKQKAEELRQQQIVAEQLKQQEIINEEKKILNDTLSDTRVKILEGLSNIQSILKKYSNQKTGKVILTEEDKRKLAIELVKFEKITEERKNLKEPSSGDLENYKTYNKIKDIYSCLDRFNNYFVSAVDNSNNEDMKKATDEIKELTKLIN